MDGVFRGLCRQSPPEGGEPMRGAWALSGHERSSAGGFEASEAAVQRVDVRAKSGGGLDEAGGASGHLEPPESVGTPEAAQRRRERFGQLGRCVGVRSEVLVGLFEESLAQRGEPLRLMAAGRALDERASARPLELVELAQEHRCGCREPGGALVDGPGAGVGLEPLDALAPGLAQHGAGEG